MIRRALFALLGMSVLWTTGLLAQRGRAAAPRTGTPAVAAHTFAFGAEDFLLDGTPFRIISCEMHPARIPAAYWAHRIRMAKAMGCNSIAVYVFWNYHEPREGTFDFTSDNHDIARFVRIAQDEHMWVLLRPGPYVCAEWDFGGLPPYLLKDPELRVRSMYPRYMQAAERYQAQLARVVRPLLVTRGGPILMVQIENEYGSYANDRRYLARLRDVWTQNGIDVPFYTSDGPTPHMLEAGTLQGAAVGLDSGSNEKHWQLARSIVPNVPIFSSETYPGWLTHWGEPWAAPELPAVLDEVKFLLANRKSFNFYVAHGGTNFGFTAGANSGGKGYEPDVTSYDYDAPIDEQGRATPKYLALRGLIGSALPAGMMLPSIPDPIPSAAVPEFPMTAFTSIWEHLPTPLAAVHPRPFETYGQNQGLVLYRTSLVGRKSGRLTITDLHDYALVFVDGIQVGTLDRRLGETTIELPPTVKGTPVLDILIEGMGHINFAQEMIDRKGITDRVTLSGMTLMNWQVFLLPLDGTWVAAAGKSGTKPGGAPAASRDGERRAGTLFRGTFALKTPVDTYLDLTGYRKGMVWVNGHNLGRYWEIGPQMRLYCPAPFLNAGANDVIVLDLQPSAARPLRGAATLK